MNNILSLEEKIAFTEVYDIIMFIDENERKKIPTKFVSFLKANKLENYITTINPYIPLELQKISKNAQNIMAYIYIRYLANNEEKEYFRLKEQKEEKKQKKALEESYNIMFKKKENSNILQNQETNNLPIEVKEDNVLKKIIKKIKKFLFKKIGD